MGTHEDRELRAGCGGVDVGVEEGFEVVERDLSDRRGFALSCDRVS